MMRSGENGYATASAVIVTLALALTVSALDGYAITELETARAKLARAQAEYGLDGVQQLAAIALLKAAKTTRLSWSLEHDGIEVGVLAEPEAAKLSWAVATKLDDAALRKIFEVDDGTALRRRLDVALADPGQRIPTSSLDVAPLWLACASSMISRYGAADRLRLPPTERPDQQRFSWRIGELWRVQAASRTGWVDDRIIRLTGDPSRPAAVVERYFFRRARGGSQCTISPNTG